MYQSHIILYPMIFVGACANMIRNDFSLLCVPRGAFILTLRILLPREVGASEINRASQAQVALILSLLPVRNFQGKSKMEDFELSDSQHSKPQNARPRADQKPECMVWTTARASARNKKHENQ